MVKKFLLLSGSIWEWTLRIAVFLPVILVAIATLVFQGFALMIEDQNLLAKAIGFDLAGSFLLMMPTVWALGQEEDHMRKKVLLGYLVVEGLLLALTALYFWEILISKDFFLGKVAVVIGLSWGAAVLLKKDRMLQKANPIYFMRCLIGRHGPFPQVFVGIAILGAGMAFIASTYGKELVVLGGVVIVAASFKNYKRTKMLGSLVYAIVFACAVGVGLIGLLFTVF